MFGHVRTLSHNRNFCLSEANVNFSTARQIGSIFEQHPEWSRGSKRLKATDDKVNPRSWRGSMMVSQDMDIAALFLRGQLLAKAALVDSGLMAADSPELDFTALAARGCSLRKPHGVWVGVTPLPDEGPELEEGAEALFDVATEDAVEAAQQPADGDAEGLQAQALADAALPINDALAEAAAISKPCRTIVMADGKLVHKSTALRVIFSGDPKSMDRLKRVAGLPRTGSSVPAEDWSSQTAFLARDPYAVLVSVGGILALAAFRSELLQVPTAKGGLFSVPDMTPEQLDMEAAQLTGSLMHLSYSGGIVADGSLPFAWSGEVGAQMRVPANKAIPFAMAAAGASSTVVATCAASILHGVFDVLLQSVGGIAGQPPPAASHSLPMSATFPYRGDEAKPWPLCNDTPRQQDPTATGPASTRDVVVACRVAGCGKGIKLSGMRLHVAGHILQRQCGAANGLVPSGSEACGFCGIVCANRDSAECKVELNRGSTSSTLKVVSSCPSAHVGMSYASASKGSATSPCTNRPVPCSICSTTGATRTHVWSYHYLDHMQTAHPSQQLSAEEVEKWALSSEEFRGVMGKDIKASLQAATVEKGLVQLKRDNGLLPNPDQHSLFWSRVLATSD